MAFAERKDMGVRVAAEKARKPDELITRSQIIPGRNIYFDYLPNWDIRINAVAGGTVAGTRSMIAYVKVTLRPTAISTIVHLDLQDDATGTGITDSDKQYFGTALYQDVFHNWNLPSKDHFLYSVEDLRQPISPSPTPMMSLPAVVGLDNNSVRIWVTDTVLDTRFDPKLWVDTDDGLMTKTRLAARGEEANYERPNQIGIETTPYYKITLMEVDDLSIVHTQSLSNEGVQ